MKIFFVLEYKNNHTTLWENIVIGGNDIMEKWKCPKCGNEEYEKDQFQATGGNFAKIFDVQNKKFITISCTKCGYTELYKTGTSAAMNIFDFLMN